MALLISLLLVSLLLSAALRKRFEQLLPMLAGIVILLCYGLAMFRALAVFVWVAELAAAGCVIWAGIEVACGRGKTLLRSVATYALTPGLLGFALLVGFYVYAVGGHVVTGTDDIYYWAIEAKSIFAHQGLVDGAHHLSPRFMTYTPGMQLFQWIGATIRGECNEGGLFVMLAVFYAVYLVPLAQGIRWRRAYLLPLFLLFALVAPALLNRDAYAMLRVDTAMGVCLGYSLYQAWSISRNAKPLWTDWLTLGVSLGVLTLVKQIGFAWALMPVGLLVMLSRREKRAAGRAWRVAMLCAQLLTYASWKVFCAANHLSGTHLANLSASVTSSLNGTWTPPENLNRLLPALWSAFTLQPAGTGAGVPSPLLGLPMLVCVAGLLLIPLLLGWGKRYPRRITAAVTGWLGVSVALFLAGFIGAFLTAFSGEFSSFVSGDTAAFQYLLERYFSPFLIGALMLGSAMIWEGTNGSRRYAAIAVTGMFILLALLSNWQLLYQNLIPEAYPVTEPEDFGLLMEENFWTEDLEDPLDAVVLYGVNPTPDKRERLQYALFPVKIVAFFGDIDTESFVRLLRDDHITHVLCMDDSNPTYEQAVQYCEDGYLDTSVPYAVQWDGDTPVITAE